MSKVMERNVNLVKTQLISLPDQYLRPTVPLEGFQPACSVQCDIYPSTGNKALFVLDWKTSYYVLTIVIKYL